ncbi:MAG: hypothetical protein CMI63_00030 [Parvularcula sp.]|uniref:hypothetical protein n=1 Tax=Hyphococcus sp. TaxID=2038636 RepID=UPI000C66CAB6|nr:hypothetical protein [Parvularcula sp.]
MLLRRVIEHVKAQNWTAVALDFVIVVVGVFIGIQVSNWNDARALREREEVYLEQLLIDLESDRVTGERGVAAATSVDAAADIFLAVLEDDPAAAAISDAELIKAVPYAGYAYLPNGNPTTYNEMISTGALGLMESVELKRSFGEYYARLSAGRQWDSLLREEQFAYRAAIRGLLTREQFAWARAHAALTPEEVPPPPEFDRREFLERARSRPEIVDSLRSMGAVQQRLRDDSRDMAARAEVLAERVKSELED